MSGSGEWVHAACPLCGSTEGVVELRTDAGPFGPTRRVALRRCRCGLGITDPQPRGAALDDQYEDVEYYTHGRASGAVERLRRWPDRLQLRGPVAGVRQALESISNLPRFTSRLPPRHFALDPGRRLLDFGCGSGRLLRVARDLGLDVTGVEPDPIARSVARERGLHVVASLKEADAAGGAAYDLVLVSHVLEHLADPVDALGALRARLADGGRVLVAVPNLEARQAERYGAAWIGWDMPRHLWHFTRPTLARMLGLAGLEVRHTTTVELAGYARASEELATRWGRVVPRGRSGWLPRIERAGRGTEIVTVATRARALRGGPVTPTAR